MAVELKNFEWQESDVYSAFVQGVDAETVYNEINGMNLGRVDYHAETRTLRGSNPWIAARIDTRLRAYGIRVANLRDFSRPGIMGMVEGRYCSDSPVFFLRTLEDSCPQNLSLIMRIAEKVETVNGKLNLPVMVTGFDVVKLDEDDGGYGIGIVARDDFRAVHDERLKGESYLRRFSEVDDLGLPKFDSNGSRCWYSKKKGISRLTMGRNQSLISDRSDLFYSHFGSRLILVRDKTIQIKD